MHAAFMPYGKIEWVETFLNDIRAQKFFIPMHSPDGKEVKQLLTQAQLRILPFGFYEVVFPREYMAEVLTTLNFNHPKYADRYGIDKMILNKIKKYLKVKDPPEFSRDNFMPWVKGIDLNHIDVHIFPLGIREDVDIIDNKPGWEGWKHEAI